MAWPFANADDEADPEDISLSEKYFAVLAFDGDEIGKWVSGEKVPRFQSQLANYTDGSGNPQGALPYFQRNLPRLVAEHRPISPSYHLQFSEALTNFALQCARPLVEVFDGRLIYSGGDDVVALLRTVRKDDLAERQWRLRGFDRWRMAAPFLLSRVIS